MPPTDNPLDESRDAPSVPVARVVLASFIGTTIEWYDFFLYGTAAALVFNKLFFPEFDPWTGTMASFGTYAVGFFARPVGGVVFGHFGDRIGRRSMLVTTLMLMGLATFGIGLLPTYDQIGPAAPVLLVVLRFIQGFGVGGEWGGAVLMAVEHGHRGRRGLYGSWVQAGVPAGSILATGVYKLISLLGQDAFMSWGWRVPFLLGIVLLGVGLFIRLHVLESPLFERLRESEPITRTPLLDVLQQYPRNVLLSMGARFAENGCFYIFTVFVLTYAVDQLKIQKSIVLNALLLASALEFWLIPLFGLLSDRIGRRPVYMSGAVGLAIFAYPFFALLDLRSTPAIFAAVVLALFVHAAMYAPQGAFFSELFGTGVRYSGASIGYQLSSPLAGGLAPLIAASLLKWSGGHPWPVAAYLIVLSVVTIVSVWLATETHRSEL